MEKRVKDIPEYFALIKNGEDTDFYHEYLNISTYYPYIFLSLCDGDILEAYGSWSCMVDEPIYKLK